MTRFAAALAVLVASSGAVFAQDIVTRAEPAQLFVAPSDLALLPAETVTVTTGARSDAAAADVLTARDRALSGVDAQASVGVTVFPGSNAPASIR